MMLVTPGPSSVNLVLGQANHVGIFACLFISFFFLKIPPFLHDMQQMASILANHQAACLRDHSLIITVGSANYRRVAF